MPKVRLCDADLAEYGGPEWVELSETVIQQARSSALITVKKVHGLRPLDLIEALESYDGAAFASLVWLSRRAAGVEEDLATFDPRPFGITLEELPGEGDADPPANRAERRATKRTTGRAGRKTPATGSTSTN